MKNIFLSLLLLIIFQAANAQQWTGSTTTSGLISRNGNIFSGNGGFALNIDTGTRALELIGSNGNIIDMRSSAFPGAFLTVFGNGAVDFNSNFPFVFNIGPAGHTLTTVMEILGNGNVLIGKTSQANSSYLLDVNGAIRANKVVVNTTGADYVFEPSYRLPSLQFVKNYVTEHHHLPDIAPAGQMQRDGVNLGDNQTLLLKKIEELTLYVIGQQEKMEKMQAEIDALKRR